MLTEKFRWVYLPYCLEKLSSGGYVVLNRDYKPIGFNSSAQLDYESYPVAVRFRRLTASTIRRLSCEGSDAPDKIYLYNGACVPTRSVGNMRAYLKRLSILGGLGIDEGKGAQRPRSQAG